MDDDFKGFLFGSVILLGIVTVITSGCTAYTVLSINAKEREQAAAAEMQQWMVEQGMIEIIEATPGEPIITKSWKKVSER